MVESATEETMIMLVAADQPYQGHRQDQEINHEQVGRENPGGRQEVIFPHVLNGEHLELAGE